MTLRLPDTGEGVLPVLRRPSISHAIPNDMMAIASYQNSEFLPAKNVPLSRGRLLGDQDHQDAEQDQRAAGAVDPLAVDLVGVSEPEDAEVRQEHEEYGRGREVHVAGMLASVVGFAGFAQYGTVGLFGHMGVVGDSATVIAASPAMLLTQKSDGL